MGIYMKKEGEENVLQTLCKIRKGSWRTGNFRFVIKYSKVSTVYKLSPGFSRIAV